MRDSKSRAVFLSILWLSILLSSCLAVSLALHFSPQKYTQTFPLPQRCTKIILSFASPITINTFLFLVMQTRGTFPQWKITLTTREPCLLSVICGSISVSIFKVSNSAKQEGLSLANEILSILESFTHLWWVDFRKRRNNQPISQVLNQIFKLSWTLRYCSFGMNIKVLGGN